MKTKIVLILSTAGFLFTACIKDKVEPEIQHYTAQQYAILQKSLDLPSEMHDYNLNLPQHLGGFPVTSNNHMATLGRVIFYDKSLSANGQISCASCHKAEHAFADDAAFSKGVTTERTSRNSLGLASFPSFGDHYSGFSNGARLFWDERASTVSAQSRESFLNPVEMGIAHMSDLTKKVREKDYYDVLFEKAFPLDNSFFNQEDLILRALEEFVNSFGFFETKYDLQLRNGQSEFASFSGFTPQENLGKTLFNTNCASCHNLGSNFNSSVTVANNGLDMSYPDKGVGGITQRQEDMDVFKVPMLRNISLSAPYMHDGRFATLEEVVEHYSSGIKNHPNLHQQLKTGNQAKKMNFTEEEKGALVAFLKTLSDPEGLAQERYADPFK